MIVTEDIFPRVMEILSQTPRWTWDLETNGLRPYGGNHLIGCAVEADGATFYFPFRHLPGGNLNDRARQQFLTELPKHQLLGFNSIRFDGPMVGVEGVTDLVDSDRVQHEDVIVKALLANENEPSFSLESLSAKYLPDSGRKRGEKAKLLEALQRVGPPRDRSPKILMGFLERLPPQEVAPYAEGDVLDTKELDILYNANLKAWNLTSLTWVMFSYARLLAKIERRGLRVDRAECQRRATRCLDDQGKLGTRLRRDLGINPSSPVQVARLLGIDNAQAETVRASGHPAAGDLIEFRRLGKMAETYYQAMLDGSDSAGIIHPQMNLSRDPRDLGGTRSCRLSCSGPNFQNLPVRSNDWYMRGRECVTARPGRVLLKADYQRAEMWMGGFYSGDQALVDAYKSDRDLYTELAERIPCSRQDSKIAWLAIQYGAGAAKLAKMFKWPHRTPKEMEFEWGPVEEWTNTAWRIYMAQPAARLKQEFFDLCPGIKEMMNSDSEAADDQGYIRLWTGRVIHCDHQFTHPFSMWNRRIQGGVAEMIRIAMLRLEAAEAEGVDMLLQVHDEIVGETDEGNERRAAVVLREIMCDFPGFEPFIPRVDISTGNNYGQMTKLEV